MRAPTLVCIGGGPKALAVAVKARVLADLGLPAPEVIIVEREAVGANWTAAGGWTDGMHRLGTSPEKDLGFPYRSADFRGFNRYIDHAMLRYSWGSYLVAAGSFGEWVDRGRPPPRHRDWARYLQWAATQAEARVVTAQVRTASVSTDRWTIELDSADGSDGGTGGWPQADTLTADALMVTGPGAPVSEWETLDTNVVGPATFWRQVANRSLPAVDRAAVIGGGETAGAILHEMCRHEATSISVIAPRASLFTRGEGYFENSVFTDSVRWETLSLAQRREVIKRADRGVFSARVMDELRLDTRIVHVEGRVSGVETVNDQIALGIETASGHLSQWYDYVIDARGSWKLWMLQLFDGSALDRLELAIGGAATTERVQMSIERSLSVGGMTPALYLPGLADLRQGPGFPNLSCLGLLSDRICASLGAVDPSPATINRHMNLEQLSDH
ncbi:SidA/IucD/PvdA family monooxygenase [Dactylosporangium sp. NPDC005572]|uniref:SidA/IucD/PvdA family monooxygenase n=1 Tax=Dactylosporangium sp. NPDC005572 TaxID=3156889 RepID=UPI0033BC6ED1